MACAEGSPEHLDLLHFKANGSGEVGRGGDVVNVLVLKELLKLFGHKGRAIVSINCVGEVHIGQLTLEAFGRGTRLIWL